MAAAVASQVPAAYEDPSVASLDAPAGLVTATVYVFRVVPSAAVTTTVTVVVPPDVSETALLWFPDETVIAFTFTDAPESLVVGVNLIVPVLLLSVILYDVTIDEKDGLNEPTLGTRPLVME